MIVDCLKCGPNPIQQSSNTEFTRPCLMGDIKCAQRHSIALQLLNKYELYKNKRDKLDILEYQDFLLIDGILMSLIPETQNIGRDDVEHMIKKAIAGSR